MSIRAGTDFYKTEKSMRRGFEAFNKTDCCSCKTTDLAIVTTCTVAGGVIGGIAAAPVGVTPGVFAGAAAGFGLGMVIVAAKNSKTFKECTIL